jgi:uncharacterized protein involved in outer membrane biogenesis
MLKKKQKIIVIFLAVFVGLLVTRNLIIGAAIQSGVKAITGLTLKVGSINVGLFRTAVRVKNLKLYNPKNYPDKIMVDIPEIFIDYDLFAFFQKKVHLTELRLDLREFAVIKNKDGETNLTALKSIEKKGGKIKPEVKTETPAKEAPPMDLTIDLVQLRIGKVLFKDYSKGGDPMIKEYNINLHREYKNINNPGVLVSLIVFQALTNTTISSLAGVDLGELRNVASGALNTAVDLTSGVANKAIDTLKGTTDTATETLKGLKDKIKLPFGKD